MLDKKRTKDEKGASTSVRRIYLRVLPAAKSVRTSENLRNCREATMRYLCRLWAFFHKDFYIRKIKRHYIYTSFEVIVPVTLLSVLVYLRYRSTHGSHPEWMGPTCYPESHPLSVITLTANDTVAYAPDNGYTQSLMNYLAKRSTSGTFYSKGYHSWAGLNKDLHGKKVLLALNLEHVNQSSLDYVISIDAPDQFSLKRYPQDNAPRNVSDTIEPYIVFPIIWNVFAHFVNYYHGSVLETPHVQLQPTGRYLKDVSFDQLTRFMSQFLLFSYIVFIGVFPRQIIQEKASRLRELLRMMGQPELVYWHGLFLTGFASMLFVAVVATVLFSVPFNGYPLLAKSNPLVILFVLSVFSVAAILQLILISVLFNEPALGAMFSILAWYLPLTMCTIVVDPQGSNTYLHTDAIFKLLSAMLPSCGCYWAFKIIGFWESADIGIQFWNLNKFAVPGDNITMLHLLLTFLISSVIFAFFIFYLDAIIPWQYGMPKDPLFIFRPSYLWPKSGSIPLKTVPPSELQDSSQVEPVRGRGEPVIVVANVTKCFGNKRVLDGLSLSFYKNQISVLLGHNGAGKTTTMNILTGLYPPTSGDIFIDGYSIRNETKLARRSIGLCPQHNVLFDDLTVEEHLRYFSIIKQGRYCHAEIESLIEQFHLQDKRHTLSKSLSGGMKRKLSMANAMVGGSTLLILDEPTAGMDTQARRDIWSILLEARKTRSILLTTHYMDEADVIGDRIAFISNGRRKCVGSPIFLKRLFDTGYKLRVSKATEGFGNRLQSLVAENVLDAFLESDMSHELVMNLGFPPTETLIKTFKALEDNRDELGIQRLGVSITTMEDVFLAVGAAEEAEGRDSSNRSTANVSRVQSTADLSASQNEVDIHEPYPQFERVTGVRLVLQQFSALLWKRFHSTRRQWWMPLFLLALPIALAILFCALVEWSYHHEQQITLQYSMEGIYRKTTGWCSSALVNNTTEGSILGYIQKYMHLDGIDAMTIPQQNFSKYLLEQASADPLGYKAAVMMGVDEDEQRQLTLWVNGQPYHAAPAALLVLQRALFEQIVGNGSAFQLQVATHPRDSGSIQRESLTKLIWVRFVAAFPLSFATAFMTSSLIVHPIQENISKVKLIQLMSGVSQVTYFGASFVFDSILLIVTSALMVAVMLIYNPLESFLVFQDTWVAMLVVFLLYAYAMAPLSYIASYLFDKPATGLMYLLVFNVFSGSIIVILMAMFDMLSLLPDNPFDLDVSAVDTSIYVLNYVPSFSVVWGAINVHMNGLAKDFCQKNAHLAHLMCTNPMTQPFVIPCCHNCSTTSDGSDNSATKFCFKHTSPFGFNHREGAGSQIVALFSIGTFLFVVLALMEGNTQKLLHMVFRKLVRWSPPINTDPAQLDVKDADVECERAEADRLVREGTVASSGEALVAHELTKYYGNFPAVRGISFRVHDRECFGLLGVNGAGKTTTFGMLTGDLLPSSGNAFIHDTNVRDNLKEFQQKIGYCPQSNPLIGTMTGREMVRLFCALRGVPPAKIDLVSTFVIALTNFEPYADLTTSSYSGGTKRKLSIALTLAGSPRVLFLDEPTAGVDPVARRIIWRALKRGQAEMGSAIVLTSHSIDECEALCHRMCIMVNGRLRCIGSAQHLTSKFGGGFTVMIKLWPDQRHRLDVLRLMNTTFGSHAVLRESHQCHLLFQVTDTSMKWSTLFQRVHDIDKALNAFEDVLVSDITLEQIFISFAKTQQEPETAHSFQLVQSRL